MVKKSRAVACERRLPLSLSLSLLLSTESSNRIDETERETEGENDVRDGKTLLGECDETDKDRVMKEMEREAERDRDMEREQKGHRESDV